MALLFVVSWAAYELISNFRKNVTSTHIAFGLGFLSNTAGFGISQTLIPFSETDTYARAYVVGLLNTLLVSGLAIMFATALGFVIGIARLSSNWLVARIAAAYVEAVRNLPLLFQILFWYLAVLGALPGPRQSIGIGWRPALENLAHWLESSEVAAAAAGFLRGLAAEIGAPGAFLNNRGLFVPRPIFEDSNSPLLAIVIATTALIAAWLIWRRRRVRGARRPFEAVWFAAGAFVTLALALVAAGGPFTFEEPQLRGFNFAGGWRVTPEFVALLAALSTYAAGFIGEIVRAGVLAVAPGQREAALALGLKPQAATRLVVMPQAMRLIVPPLTSQYVNLVKNSSLAIAIGYPDLFAVFAGTTLFQTGQAVPIIVLTMATYLLISLLTSALMNWRNMRLRIVER